jgi:prepilin-type N-terminal cleavage/methylation domain-containing protein
MTAERRTPGFTLLETLVALVLFTGFALVLLELQGGTARDLERAGRDLEDARTAALALDLARLGLDPARELAPWLREGVEILIERQPATAEGARGLERLAVVIVDPSGERFRLATLVGR